MKNVKTKKLYFHKETGKAIFITSIIEYEGTKRMVVHYNTGYGASEVREKKEFTYEEYDEFVFMLEDKQPIKDVKSTNLVTVKKKQIENKTENKMENKNNFQELRSILFDTLRDVKNGKIDEKKAKSISELSQVLINSAKVEVDYLKATGSGGKSKMIEQ